MRYFLDTDEDCHWYLIPDTMRIEWNNWCRSDAGEYTEAPKWARSLGHHPNMITFELPEYED